MNFVTTFEFDRETKNTVRYQELSERPIVGMLYIRKDALTDIPKKIVVTIETVEEVSP